MIRGIHNHHNPPVRGNGAGMGAAQCVGKFAGGGAQVDGRRYCRAAQRHQSGDQAKYRHNDQHFQHREAAVAAMPNWQGH